ncbi:transporter substrate-binding domain-containing protein [Bacillus sp. FJAT-45350]|uniref:transporter substrate-binding domain-containing protein n=1 Tax=Bacillus sp. FJAT-45350 TaxID=2011014 RepID=UPI000BB9B375|nr:transporter substrate-binding domain-containing protein [Bacillus sp. FJAT-45350]
MKKLLSLGLSAVLSVGLLVGCGAGDTTSGNGNEEAGDSTEEKKVLVMGTSADYPPFESVDSATGEIVGFDVDIARYITEQLGYEFKIEDMEFSTLVPALTSGRADFVLAGMTPTEERKQNVDFSDIYHEANNLIITKSDSGITSVEDLAGKTVGVQLGSIQEEAAKEIDGIEMVQRDRIPALVQELLSNRIDAAIIEDAVALGHLNQHEVLTSFILLDDEPGGSAIGFPKDSELVGPFNEILLEMKESGMLEELMIKWFSEEE